MSKIDEVKQEYTKSAIIDKLVEEFQADPTTESIINSLQFQKAILTLNPSKFPSLLEICATVPDSIHLYVRGAVVELLNRYMVPKPVLDRIESQFKLKLLFDEIIPLDKVTATYENTIIQTIAQVVAVGKRESYIKEIKYKCPSCEKTENSLLEELKCLCGTKMIAIETIFGDTVMAEIQQPYDEITIQPDIFTAQFFDEDAVDVKIGDLKKIVLIRKSDLKKGNKNRPITLHIISSTSMEEKTPKLPDDVLKQKFHTLAKDKEYLNFLGESMAPTVVFQNHPKLACLLAIIGGTPVSGLRNNIHAMIAGDPSEAKTTILKYFTRLPYQKCGYAVGMQASGQGITIAMTKLPDGTSYPRAGLLTLCSGGYAAIDEFNLMKVEDMDKCRESAEDGEISYNKGGFNIKLNANTTILTGLNPRWHVYDYQKSMKDNLNVPAPILSRFDIKTNITSQKDILREKRIINHIYNIKAEGVDKHIIDKSLLTAKEISLLINYAKTFKPIASPKIREKLINFYIQQKQYEFEEDTEKKGLLRIDRRTGRSLNLLAEAYARLYLCNEVMEEHADLAIKFAKECVRTFGFDPERGLVQTNLLESTMNAKEAFELAVSDLCAKDEKHSFNEEELVVELTSRFPNLFKHDGMIREWLSEHTILGSLTYKAGRYTNL